MGVPGSQRMQTNLEQEMGEYEIPSVGGGGRGTTTTAFWAIISFIGLPSFLPLVAVSVEEWNESCPTHPELHLNTHGFFTSGY